MNSRINVGAQHFPERTGAAAADDFFQGRGLKFLVL
jgi:hypothetical protein